MNAAERARARTMYRRALAMIDEESGSGSVREEQARGAMLVLGDLLGRRAMTPAEREKWLGET